MASAAQLGLIPRTTARPPFTIEVPGQKPVEGETPIRRIEVAKEGLHTKPDPKIATVYDLVRVAVDKYGNAKAVASRRLITTHQETKKVKKVIDGQEREVDKKWTYFELSPYEYMSYVEYEKMLLEVGSAFRKLGLVKGDRVHIYAATSAHWMAVAHGSTYQSMAIVTAYDTLGEDGLRHSMVATGAKAIFLDPHLLPTLTNVLKEATEVRYVIWNDQNQLKKEHAESLKAAYPHIQILSFDELRKLGRENPADPVPPDADELCCIMYTSGSTGTPKGVPLKHRNVVAAVAGAHPIIKDFIGPGDGLLAYLPLAHILEFVFEHAAIHWGACLGYGNAKTLSDTSVRNCFGDIREFKPSVMIGVPAVWESVKKGIISKVESSGFVVRNMFWGAMWAKSRLLALGLPGVGLLDAVVFKKLKEATGGRLKLTLSAGGPLSKETQRFLSMAICELIIGYGLTETAAMGTIMHPHEWDSTSIGGVTAAIEAKLVDFPDAGYFSTNKPFPQGELWLRGPSICEGYYQNDKETAEAITADGWFKTGDIAEFQATGHIELIDRKKNLIKTQNGEYIALEKLEAVYRSAPVAANLCVYADETKVKPVAIIVAADKPLQAIAKSIGVEGETFEQLIHNKKVQAAVLKEIQNLGRAGGLSGIEIVDAVVLTDDEWTPQNGLVTAAQKLNRKGILNKHKKEVAEAYKASSS